MKYLRIILKPENIFALFALFFGLIVAFGTPAFFGLDESAHFFRLYQIAEGDISPTKEGDRAYAFAPSNMEDAINNTWINSDYINESPWDYFNFDIDKSSRTKIDITNAAVYSPFCYLPQLLFLKVAMVFTKNLLFIHYLIRIVGLLSFIAMGYFAIRKFGFNKWLIMFLALLPVTVAQASVLNADGMTFGLIYLLASQISAIIAQKEIVSKKQIIWMGITCAILAIVKQAYLPLLVLVVLTYGKFGSYKRAIKSIGLMAIASLICFLLWQWQISGIKTVSGLVGVGNYELQLGTLKNNPIWFAKVLGHTFFSDYGVQLFKESIGSLFWWEVNFELNFGATTFAMMVLILLSIVHQKNILLRWQRVTILGIILINILLISIIFFMVWTPHGDWRIAGMQGRYFTPFLLPICLSFANKKITFGKWTNVISGSLATIASFALLLNMAIYFI